MSVPRYPNETAAESPTSSNGDFLGIPLDAKCETVKEMFDRMFPGQEITQAVVDELFARLRQEEGVTEAVQTPAPLDDLVAEQKQQIADLEAKLDAERTLRAQGAAELEREKAHERDRRIQADARARDALGALDAAIEALAPMAGFATEEDGRVSGMTNPVCLAMSSVRRADAMVKLHRALRR